MDNAGDQPRPRITGERRGAWWWTVLAWLLVDADNGFWSLPPGEWYRYQSAQPAHQRDRTGRSGAVGAEDPIHRL